MRFCQAPKVARGEFDLSAQRIHPSAQRRLAKLRPWGCGRTAGRGRRGTCRIEDQRLRRDAGAQATTPVNATRANGGPRRRCGRHLPDRGQAATSSPVPTSRRRTTAATSARECDRGERRDAGAAPAGSRPSGSVAHVATPGPGEPRGRDGNVTCRIAASLASTRAHVATPVPQNALERDAGERRAAGQRPAPAGSRSGGYFATPGPHHNARERGTGERRDGRTAPAGSRLGGDRHVPASRRRDKTQIPSVEARG